MLRVYLELIAAIVVLLAVVHPALKELRHVYRCRRVARELDRARRSPTYADPAVFVVGARRHSGVPAPWPPLAVPPVQPDDGHVYDYVARRAAVDRALAAEGYAVDELQLDDRRD